MCIFSRKQDQVHMAADRRLWFTHKCRFCNYFFVCEKDLVHHEATHDSPNFACDSCSRVFEDAEQLNAHVNDGCLSADSSTDIGRQHVCGTCGEIFRFVRELYKHYSERHMNERSTSQDHRSGGADGASSICANCGAMFSGTASLKVHLWKAHNLNVVQQQNHILKKNGSSTVTCSESHAASTCKRLLVSDKDKPFKCSMCNWSFKYDFSFRAHLKMHEEKQKLLEEMLRANCESQSSVADDAEIVNDHPDASNGDVSVPVTVFPLKRKLEYSNDADCLLEAKSSIVCDTKCSQSMCCLTMNMDVDADGAKQLCCSDQHSVVGTPWKPVSVTRVSSELLRPSPNLSPVIRNTGRHSVIEQLASVDRCLPDSEEPFRFACKLCSFKCRYDFSYVAHLNQHDKLKELEIDDLQTHLVASSNQTPSSSRVPNKFAIKVLSTDAGDVSYVNGHTQVVDSSGISYILLCSGAVDQTALVTGLADEQQYESTVVAQPTAAPATIDCLNTNVVLVDDVNTSIEQDLDSAARPATDDDDADFSVGPEMQFLDTTSGETLYVINETDLQVALPMDAAADRQKNIVYEEAKTESEVILTSQPSDRQMLDVASLYSDEDVQSDESEAGEDSFTCYYCSAMFANISRLQQHILQLHVE